MAEAQPEQSQTARALAILTAALVFAAFVALAALPLREPVGTDVTHRAIKKSAKLPVVMWCLAWPIALAKSSTGLGVRWGWALGCALLFVHIAVAFHLGHGWSHAHAWEHTRAVGGYGDGIYVNYTFALVWLADALWALAAFGSYCRRPRWLHWGVHGFLAFVVFNAAFVFADSPMRRTFAYWFLVWIALIVWVKRFRRVDTARAD